MTLARTCACCGQSFDMRWPDDPWEGRLDDYCDRCASARCDAYPAECPALVPDDKHQPGEGPHM